VQALGGFVARVVEVPRRRFQATVNARKKPKNRGWAAVHRCRRPSPRSPFLGAYLGQGKKRVCFPARQNWLVHLAADPFPAAGGYSVLADQNFASYLLAWPAAWFVLFCTD
jgi:hypothetical protein